MNRFNKRMIGNNCLIFFMCSLLASCAIQPQSTKTTTVQETDGKPSTIFDPGNTKRNELIKSGVPDASIALLKKREGFEQAVYRGLNGYLTAGYGHILVEEEKENYKEGTIVPQKIIDEWLDDDAKTSWKAAVEQAFKLGDKRLAAPLFAVNFQLGIYWSRKHPKTMAMLQIGDWPGTIEEIMTSKWCKQTMLRCKDFEKALLAL